MSLMLVLDKVISQILDVNQGKGTWGWIRNSRAQGEKKHENHEEGKKQQLGVSVHIFLGISFGKIKCWGTLEKTVTVK